MALTKPHVRMVEVGRNRWDLLGPKGNAIASDILLYSRTEVEEWVKAYISSFMGWTYEIVNYVNK